MRHSNSILAGCPKQTRMQAFIGKYCNKKCAAFCSGSRDSTSSTDSEQLHALSTFGPAMAQARLDQMITNSRLRVEPRRRGIILVAMDKSSCDPRRDFRESMLEVITSRGMEDTKELRSLLNCYLSMNSRENRQAILEAFHEVCSSLFL